MDHYDLNDHGTRSRRSFSFGGDLPSAILGIIKGMVGPAILYLPHGFANAGYVIALLIMSITTCMYLYSSQCLLDSWKIESRNNLTSILKGEQEPLLLNNNNKLNFTIDDEERKNDIIRRTLSSTSSTITNTDIRSTNAIITKTTTKKKKKKSNKQKRQFSSTLSYPDLAYKALGPKGENIVKFGIALMQSGICLTYLIFVPQNCSKCIKILFGLNINPSYFMIVMLVCQIPLSWITDIKKLTITNLIANLFILYGLITCIYFAISNIILESIEFNSRLGPLEEILYRLWNLDPINNSWFLFIGPSILLFEGSVSLLLPIQESIKYTKEERDYFPIMYRKVILYIIIFYAFFGIICWMSFGNTVHTVLTTSLPDCMLATTVQLAYSIAVIFTFPLQNFPSLEIITNTIIGTTTTTTTTTTENDTNNNNNLTNADNNDNDTINTTDTAITTTSFMIPNHNDHSIKENRRRRSSTNIILNNCSLFWKQRNVIASTMVCLLAIIAILAMNNLDKVVSLIGSLFGCPIAFVFPPLIHTKLDPTLSNSKIQFNIFVACMGISIMIFASVTTILTW